MKILVILNQVFYEKYHNEKHNLVITYNFIILVLR
jgi:hypothetical protein